MSCCADCGPVSACVVGDAAVGERQPCESIDSVRRNEFELSEPTKELREARTVHSQ